MAVLTVVVETGTLRKGMLLRPAGPTPEGASGPLLRVVAIRRSLRHRTVVSGLGGPTEELDAAPAGPELLGVAVAGRVPGSPLPGPSLVGADGA